MARISSACGCRRSEGRTETVTGGNAEDGVLIQTCRAINTSTYAAEEGAEVVGGDEAVLMRR